jgi:CBS domain-containing membrane protein
MKSVEPCRMSGQVEDLMTPDPVTVKPDAKLGEVWRLMSERRFRHMLVAGADRRLLGLVTQRDLISAARSGASGFGFEDARAVSELMHREVDTVRAECCAAEAARHMLRSKHSCLPVVDVGRVVVGILTEADYLRMATRGVPACTCGGVDVVKR